MRSLKLIERCVHNCRRCGDTFGNSACGFGKDDKPYVFFIGTNPWVKDHAFEDGKGISILKRNLAEWKFDDFYFCNIVKCQMPWNGNPRQEQIDNCRSYLLEQIEVVRPGMLVFFGKQVSESFGLRFLPWTFENFGERDVLIVPHFSSILYGGTIEDIKRYYRRLKEDLDID